VHAALGAGKRVLGICRGMQLLAVALGGTLVADLPAAGFFGHDNAPREDERVHELKVEAGSHAESVLGGHSTVNSLHHQAVADPGPQARVSAVETGRGLGIQWHPERLGLGEAGRLDPFEWLVAP
jgi:putative glutamine amidotransferase